jgi:TolB protein
MNAESNPSENDIHLSWETDRYQISPGGRETIRLTVANRGAERDYFEIAVRGVPSEWVTLDPPVVQLEAGGQREAELIITTPEPAQSRADLYTLEVRVTSQTDPDVRASISGELTVAAFQSEGRIGVLLAATQFVMAPGGSITIPMLLYNRGLSADTFQLSVEGIPTSWVATASAQTRLEPGEQKEIEITLRPPRAPTSRAGRRPFSLQVRSRQDPDQQVQVDCLLTLAVYSEFSSQLQPQVMAFEQTARVVVKNGGNSPEIFSLEWSSPESSLVFERVQRGAAPAPSGGETKSFTPLRGPQQLRVPPGEAEALEFRARPRSRPLLGGEYRFPFTTRVQSTAEKVVTHTGEVVGRGLIPTWLAVLLVVLLVSLPCISLYLASTSQDRAAGATQTVQAGTAQVIGATQTAAFNQTQAVAIGQEDSDGDGLTNNQEVSLGTDPLNPDTDRDELLDGDEVNNRRTDPLNADTDGDGLSDGEEVIRRSTDPLNPDTDGDALNDGDEVQRGTNPLNPDTDQDGLRDSDEVNLGTDPLNPDTDSDQLQDGQETPPCPDPLTPDSDGDGIIDGRDLDPCDPNNPALTATTVAVQPTETVVPPTQEASATPEATLPAATTEPPDLSGVVLFESNRDGNFEIYVLNAADLGVVRLTNNPPADTQPALAPDSVLVAYVTNQENNNEIFLTGVDRRVPINLTNDPADDQQPAWSPDGGWIAFTTNRDGDQEIYVMRSDGSELRNVSNHPGNDSAPSWFEISNFLGREEWIVFTSDRDGNREIYAVKPDGTDLRNLSNNPANDYSPSGSGVSGQIAFVSERDGNPEIYLMNFDGSGQINLTNNGARDLDPFIGPTGQWVAFTSERDGNLEIYVVRTNGESAFNLTQNPAQDRSPFWR